MDFDAFDKQVGDVLASVPTAAQNADHLRAIEDDAAAELYDEVKVGWITSDYAQTALLALHRQIHPEIVK